MKAQSTSAAKNSPLAQLSVYLLIVALLAPLGAPISAKAVSEPAKAVFNRPAPAAVSENPAPVDAGVFSEIGADADLADWSLPAQRQRRLAAIQPGAAAPAFSAFSLPSIFSGAAPGSIADTTFAGGKRNSDARRSAGPNPAAAPAESGSGSTAKLTAAPAVAPAAPPPPPAGTRTPFDFDGDFKADIGYWRSGTGIWETRNIQSGSVTTQAWGALGDRIVPADYNNDNRTDHAVWTPATGIWQIRYSNSGQSFSTQFGGANDLPFPGNYDGDGSAEIAVYRPSDGMWYIRRGDGSYYGVQFGAAYTDIPAPGDYDGDGKTDLAVYRPSEGKWYYRYSQSGAVGDMPWGISSDVPVPADYDADGKTDFAVWRAAPGNPSGTGTWYVYKSADGGMHSGQLGIGGAQADVLVPADYDGDGRADFAAWRPSTGNWFISCSSNGALWQPLLGASGDVPVPAVYIKQTIPPPGQPSTNPTGSNAAASPNPVTAGTTTRLSVQVTPGANPTSTGLYVNGNLSSVGGAGNQPFYHNGNNVYIFDAYVPPGTAAGGRSLQLTVGDGQTRTSYAYIYLTVNTPPSTAPTGSGGAAPNQVAAGASTLLTVQITPGANPTSTGIGVTANLAALGGSSAQTFYDNGTNGDQVANNNVFSFNAPVAANTTAGGKSLPVTITEAQGRPASTSIYVTVTAPTVTQASLSRERLAPRNATGGTNLYSQNFGWGTGLVSLPGRAGLDAGLSLSYNSLIWTRVGNTMVFDADKDNVSPGFRFGFPVIEQAYYDSATSKSTYLMVTPSGGRVELRQRADNGNLYDAADSSYLQLQVLNGTQLVLRATDGTQMNYLWSAGAYRCSRITDRNGNYIDIVHNGSGLLTGITDTLGRVITVNYDGTFPTSITQTWKTNNGGVGGADYTYPHATFAYTYISVNTNFGGLSLSGTTNGNVLKVLERVTSADGSSTRFEYNGYGQVTKVSNHAADGHPLNSTRTNLQNAGYWTDCPRFTETYSYIENFNGGAETTVSNSTPQNDYYAVGGLPGATGAKVTVAMVGAPNNVSSTVWYHPAGTWREGLPAATEDYGDGVQQRWTTTAWTQDNANLTYILNPRVTESKVGDAANVKRTEIDYGPNPSGNFGLVSEVRLFGANTGGALLKRVNNVYKTDQAYTDRRIIGLPALVETRGMNQQTNQLELTSKTTYAYDENGFAGDDNPAGIVQRDGAYGAGFVYGRGNLTAVTRHDVAGQLTATVSRIRYNTTGAPTAQSDPLNRTVTINYADSFNDNVARNTYAYPTKITDPAGNFSEVQYRFDIGANVWAKSPVPAGQTAGTLGKITKRWFDTLGRLEKESILNNGAEHAYTKYEYPSSQKVAIVKTTLTDSNGNNVGDAADEVVAESHLDGAGRVYQSRSSMTFSAGGGTATWTGQKVVYDLLGRAATQTTPTEIDANWNPTGTDQTRGWQWTSQQYDWKGRVLKEIGLGGVERDYAYDGCGCAGGQVTTVYGELVDGERRTRKMYADALGRTWKTEVLDYNDNVYTSTVTKFNGRDQAVWTKQFAGAAPSDALTGDVCPAQAAGEAQSCQIAISEYDGFGRLKKSRAPQQDAGKFTSYTYNDADQPQTVTDARGAVSTYAYNSRGLLETIQQTMPINQPAMPFATCAPGDDECFSGAARGTGSSSPVGYLDYADTTSRTIGGWSVDKDSPSSHTEVHFYLDGPAGSGPGTGIGIGTTIANKVRPDVSVYHPGNHGFEFVVPEQYADGKPHLIYAYGIDVAGGNPNVLLTNSPKSILLTPATKTTTFEYDALGNRTKMTDATGVTNYEYDALSRVKAENKHLKDNWSITRKDYNIRYDYHLSGQLKSVTDPFNDKINYGVDKIGRLKGITGTPFNSTDASGTAAVTNYINNIEYRAWGDVKAIDYGNTIKMTQTFDNRLRVGEFDVRKNGQAGALIKKAYQYYNDDRLKFSDDTGDTFFRQDAGRFDRSYSYDFMGRLTGAKTGTEANGATTSIDRNITPYKHDYTFNAFGNVTSRQTFTWTEADNETNSWTNGRESKWRYDADGRLKHTAENNYDYDASGAVIAVALADARSTYQMTDGEGRTVRRDFYDQAAANGSNVLEKTEYAIYSSVLGQLLTEVKSDGTKKRTFVHGAGGIVATQNTEGETLQHVAWEHRDPSNASYISTTNNGGAIYSGAGGQAELDPLGSNVGTANPFNSGGQASRAAQPGGHGSWGDPFGSFKCLVDWVEQPCTIAAAHLAGGGGDIGPLDQFRRVTNPRTGETAWGQFRNLGNGMSGWWAGFNGPSSNGDIIRIGVDEVRLPYNPLENTNRFTSRLDRIISEQNSDEDIIGSTYDTITPKKGQENHEGKCRALKKSIEGHNRQAQRHLDNYGRDFSSWKHPQGNYLTGQLDDYQQHVDLVRQETMEYMMFCNDQGPPPPVPIFFDVPLDIRNAGKKTTLERMWDSLPSIPPFPTDKQVEEFYKKYPPVFIPMPGRRIPRLPLRF